MRFVFVLDKGVKHAARTASRGGLVCGCTNHGI
jgi:hypothetical protein